MDFKDYQERYFKTNPNYLAVYIANNLEFNTVIDLGCGSGNETVYFLKKGKEVIAVDKIINKEYFYSRIKDDKKLTLEECAFEDWQFKNADAIFSTFALSFCSVDKFQELWNTLYEVLPKGGILAANLFGKKDTFASEGNVNVFSKEEVLYLLKNYDVVKFKEQEYDQEQTGKHRHYYDFVAIKKG
ncbi:MAG: class I SAM-dependent methyltransferase [Bacilli bacterium]|nr:class I SAM-dependent methyltransferase [Bacilli bacterium]